MAEDPTTDATPRQRASTDGEETDEASLEPRVDAADRLERVIEAQIATLDGIDTKAQHVTRLVAILLGVVLSVLSLAGRQGLLSDSNVTAHAVLALGLGIVALLLSMTAAVVTYLGSRFKSGLHQNVGYVLSDPEHDIDAETHFRRVVGNYGHIVEQNKRVIHANAARFRLTLLLLLVGILYISLSVLFYFTTASTWSNRLLLLLSVGLVGVLSWYVLGGKYLALEEDSW